MRGGGHVAQGHAGAALGAGPLVQIGAQRLGLDDQALQGGEVAADIEAIVQAFVALPTENKVAIVSLPSLSIEGYLPTGKTPDGLACAPVAKR